MILRNVGLLMMGLKAVLIILVVFVAMDALIAEGSVGLKKEDLLKRLSPEQFAVTQKCSTEPQFHNAYWDNHAPGIYVDVVDGKPLFSSLDKYDSGSGWPSFTKPIESGIIESIKDESL